MVCADPASVYVRSLSLMQAAIHTQKLSSVYGRILWYSLIRSALGDMLLIQALCRTFRIANSAHSNACVAAICFRLQIVDTPHSHSHLYLCGPVLWFNRQFCLDCVDTGVSVAALDVAAVRLILLLPGVTQTVLNSLPAFILVDSRLMVESCSSGVCMTQHHGPNDLCDTQITCFAIHVIFVSFVPI